MSPSLHAAGKFTVQGNRIVDPEGKVFVARGANINGYQANWNDQHMTIADLGDFQKHWKFNFARLYCRLFKSNSNKLGGKDQLYNIIDTYIKAKVVVMLTYHDHTGGMYTGSQLNELIDFNGDIAEHFKNHPQFTYLWFETMNEPGQRPLNDIDAMNRKFIEAVRARGAKDNIFCAPGNNFSQEGVRWDSSPVTQGESYILSKGKAITDWNENKWGHRNVIFSPHFYRIWIHGDNKMKTFIQDVYKQNLPLVVGEYGKGTDGKDCSKATQSLMTVGHQLGVGRVVWHWSGRDENKLVTTGKNGGREINKTDGSKPTNLTWLGSQVWDDSHRAAIPPPGGTTALQAHRIANRSGTKAAGYVGMPGLGDVEQGLAVRDLQGRLIWSAGSKTPTLPAGFRAVPNP